MYEKNFEYKYRDEYYRAQLNESVTVTSRVLLEIGCTTHIRKMVQPLYAICGSMVGETSNRDICGR